MLVLQCRLSPGDVLMLTAAVRDLHRAFPGQFITDIETSAPDLWAYNPWITKLDRSQRSNASVLEMHYPLINSSNQKPVHFLQGYIDFLERCLRLRVPVTEFRGDIYLSGEERNWTNQVEETFGFKGTYWIMMAGGKYDFTAKWWPPDYYQEVVDRLAGRVQFVQCGEKHHWHPPLRGVFDLVGKTSIRQFVRLMYHAQGVVCPVTFAMHLAAAVPSKFNRLRPCVVIGGGREPPHWEAYPGHQYLHTIGMLPCCAMGGCWKSRCQPVGDGNRKDDENMCERPVPVRSDLKIAQCMTMIKSDDVIRVIEKFVFSC
ncbi:MAG: ADP-heptose--LPS heptosyltransferase [Burkholderiales bacterium]|nr:ADP-heptose--LPS heptosyltransferase [Phycisphaerae bacterium]